MISQVRPRLHLLALKCCAGLLFSASIGALAQEPKKPPPQPGPMLARINEALKPGGWLVVIDDVGKEHRKQSRSELHHG